MTTPTVYSRSAPSDFAHVHRACRVCIIRSVTACIYHVLLFTTFPCRQPERGLGGLLHSIVMYLCLPDKALAGWDPCQTPRTSEPRRYPRVQSHCSIRQ